MRWNEWRGSLDGRPVMLIKHLFRRGGFKVDLHAFVRSDDEECFHTHPRWALRMVLWGGYVEELISGRRRFWFPLRIGLVRPELCHRIAATIYHRSYSLWIVFPTKKREIKLYGIGWKNNSGATHD